MCDRIGCACKRVLRVAPVPAARHVTPTFTGLTRASHILRIGSQHLARHPGFSNKQVLTRYPDMRGSTFSSHHGNLVRLNRFLLYFVRASPTHRRSYNRLERRSRRHASRTDSWCPVVQVDAFLAARFSTSRLVDVLYQTCVRRIEYTNHEHVSISLDSSYARTPGAARRQAPNRHRACELRGSPWALPLGHALGSTAAAAVAARRARGGARWGATVHGRRAAQGQESTGSAEVMARSK